ncbi:MAG: signal peptidase I [Candidatus Nealsonbacteria bacterium]|nr:signal peptidase I [Candidatus Nealsonbacteria bacterium]
MKSLKIIYYIVIAFIVLVAILLIVSAFPIPGNYKVLVVQSGSMEPKIKTGSIVVVKPEKDFKIGDVITFGPYSKTKAPTTHRIYDMKVVGGEPIYITKGDANNAPDTREIKKADIVGKVLFSVPFLGYAVDFAKKPIGFALLIIVPAALIIVDEIKKIYAEIKKKKTK